MHGFSDYGSSNPDDSSVSQFSIKISELNDKCIEIRNNANNEILLLRQKVEEDARIIQNLEKLVVKTRNEVSNISVSKDKELKKLSLKLMEAEKAAQIEDKKSQMILKKKICALKCNMSKLEASKTKLEERLRQVEMELETEKILRRKKKVKDKTDASKYNEMTTKLTRSIECLQSRIKELEKEKRENEEKAKNQIKKRKLLTEVSQSNQSFKITRRSSEQHATPNHYNTNRPKTKLSHSQSNDALLLKSKLNETLKTKNRDNSQKHKSKKVPHLNLSEITQGSPISSHRLFSTRSNKNKTNGNTTTTNISFCNSYSGIFKNGVIGSQGDGSGKYCAACKFKEWKKKQLNYDVEELVRNRDMIRVVQCLGCAVQYEVKHFLEHVRSCRLAYNIPSMVPRDEVFAKMSYNNHKYFTSKKSDKSVSSLMQHDIIKGIDNRESHDFNSKDSDNCSFLSGSHKNLNCLKSLSMVNNGNNRSSFNPEQLRNKNTKTPKERTSDAIEKLRMQRLRMSNNDKYLRDNSDFLSASVKYNDHIKKPRITRLNSTKNFRYSNQVNDDDSDEPVVPNEKPRDLSSVELDNDNDENDSSSLSQYQTVPRNKLMAMSSDKNVNKYLNLSGHIKENMDDHISENQDYRTNILCISPESKPISPLVKIKNLRTSEIESHDFKLEAMSEF